MADGDDVLDSPREGHCPRCGAKLMQPSIDPEQGTYEPGEETFWCPGCGWTGEDPFGRREEDGA